ncbi:tRNA-dihydrouridine(20) synthase [NAD(P)+]-like [Gigantopelta aegis]|uniref:tRNA-dihydrouridine(20) synthase [NAD(P)+]-like n=1 Tax=Gigantopelta aegis TaxID=1735272 RepID=UPI001B88971E|nr:tRNA-dihydrouridine(20) synthase [NAD(P)+]-like [Gigantopelta aegis]XP_041375441.1 tRNA-dihydrouridine(20) synthase [NAD(P)+]-like [Gigantopelta aegis]
MSTATMVDYTNKKILAPMVRISSLPMRLLSLEYGADLVYCEEIIDHKILSAKRIENELLGTVDYVLSDETVVFRTCPQEKEKLIFQLGTCDAQRALRAAKKVEKDISGIDVNMGCPKEFSIKGGMGAALLTQPEKVKQILTTLVNGLTIPVTCKIRILPQLEDTISLAKIIESTGVAALAIHGRTKAERPQHRNHNDVIKAVAQTLTIPVIANGASKEITTFEDIEKFRLDTGASSVMLARSAEWNTSVFRSQGRLLLHDVIKQYLRYAIDYDNNVINTKYCILNMMHDNMKDSEGEPMLGVTEMSEICKIWNMSDQYNKVLEERKKKKAKLVKQNGADDAGIKRRKLEDGKTLFELPVRFIRMNYPDAVSPKQLLHNWCLKNHCKAHYDTVERPEDRCFNSVITLGDIKYTTPYWEKTKRHAEQGAAIAFLVLNDIPDGRIKNSEDAKEDLPRKWRAFYHTNTEPCCDKNYSPVLSNPPVDSVHHRGQGEESPVKTTPDLSTGNLINGDRIIESCDKTIETFDVITDHTVQKCVSVEGDSEQPETTQ